MEKLVLGQMTQLHNVQKGPRLQMILVSQNLTAEMSDETIMPKLYFMHMNSFLTISMHQNNLLSRGSPNYAFKPFLYSFGNTQVNARDYHSVHP